MRINFGNIIYQVILFVLYVLISFCGQNMLSAPVYYSTLNYFCKNDSNIYKDNEKENCW